MRIRLSQLRHIIKEEAQRIVAEGGEYRPKNLNVGTLKRAVARTRFLPDEFIGRGEELFAAAGYDDAALKREIDEVLMPLFLDRDVAGMRDALDDMLLPTFPKNVNLGWNIAWSLIPWTPDSKRPSMMGKTPT